jgi:Zn-dependent peptidase ImmA (M78 family)/DNA-binding XRE family transcriptional regulator
VSVDSAQGIAPIFDSARLRLAREVAGLRKSELALKLEVTPAAVSQFESGVAKPSPTTLRRLSMLLEFPPEFFAHAHDPEGSLDISTTFFRSLRSTKQVDRQRAVAHAALVSIVVQSLEQKVRLPALHLPIDLHIELDAELDEIEGVAEQVRKRWEIPEGPISHVVRLLELNGVIVTRFRTDAHEIDAFSRPFPERRPVVVLGDDKDDLARSRLDAAHELGHLVMHPDPEPGNRTLERQASAFAAALLMPRELVYDLLPRQRVDWKHMVELKRTWGVSIAALLYRARTLGTLDRTRYETAMKMMSRKGWRKREPGYLGHPERPVLLHKAVEKLKSAGFSTQDLLQLTRLSEKRFNDVFGENQADELVLEREELLA